MQKIEINAYAKINISLDTLKKRSDGYHDLSTIMHTVSLCDKVTVLMHNKNEINVSSNSKIIPSDKTNLAYKAAQLFFETFNIGGGADIFIEKNIPIAAGLAGGSADAAAVLKALCIMCDISLSKSQISNLGIKIGADVPFCLMGGCCLAQGKGEILTPISPLKDCSLVIATPDLHLSTKWVYENLNIDSLCEHPDTNGIILAIENGNLREVCIRMYNTLETVSVKEYPIITKLKSTMIDCGAMGSIMSGSGPSVFGIFDDVSKAMDAYEKLSSLAKHIYITRPVN